MKKSVMIGISALAVCAAVAFIVFKGRAPKTEKESWYVQAQKAKLGACPGPSVERLMKDRWMGTSLPEGKNFRFLPNWYACHTAERDEMVLYRYSFEREPVVRRVVGIPGDHFEWVEDKAHKSWNLLINGKMVYDKEKEAHYFGAAGHAPVLSLYGKNGKGLLGPKNYIVFTRVSPSVLDSGMFGVVNIDDFIGKVEPVESK